MSDFQSRVCRALKQSFTAVRTGPDPLCGADRSFWVSVRPNEGTPSLRVEIVRPDDEETAPDRVRARFAEGARLVWVLDLRYFWMSTYEQPGRGIVRWLEGRVPASDILPGFSCRVSDLFD